MRSASILLFVFSLLAAACGGAKDNTSDKAKGANKDFSVEQPTTKKAEYGGDLTYGIEADPGGGTAGFCLPEAQLAIAGMVVSRTFYDTLTVPNNEGGYSPWLAESVTPNATYDSWDIKVREGVTFHDGSKLDAEVVKMNFDAFRGKLPARKPVLFLLIFQNITDVIVKDPMTVTVTTKTPWPAFPAYLWSNARFAISAKAQLESTDCASKIIGTGPFKFEEYVQGDHVSGLRNENYWAKADNGDQLPYLDSITLKVVVEGMQRVSGLESGALNVVHVSGGSEIRRIREMAEANRKQLIESDKFGEVSYALLNVKKPPFNNINARLAVAHGLDRQDVINKSEDGVQNRADGPFSKGSVGYLEDPGFPEYDVAKAKEYLAKYEAETGKALEVTIGHTPDAGVTKTANLVREQAQALGVKVNLQPIEQGSLINTALGGNFEALLWRNHPGGDPDTQYVWWHSGMITNFSGINDPQIDADLDQGRVEPDPEKRKALYEDLNRQFAKNAYNIWNWFTLWAIGFDTKVHNILGPKLPDDSAPSSGLANAHSLAGLWMEK